MITENQIQYDFVKQIREFVLLDKRLELLHHIPNGSKFGRHRIHMWNMGCVAGIPDFFLPVAENGYHGLYLELKSSRGRLSDVQKEIAGRLNYQGYAYALAKSVDDAMDIVLDYVGITYAKDH